MKKIKVLIVDDHTIFRQGLKALLEDESDIEVVGEAGTSKEAIELAAKLCPSVIVMDINLPDLNGLQASDLILRGNPDIKIIILSMSDDVAFVTQALQAGVRGYLVKQTAASELLRAIREVMRGNAHFSPSISKILAQNQTKPQGNELTLRDREVLQLIAEGKTTKEIGLILLVSAKTVEKHRQQIMDKLEIRDIASLTRYALANGIVK